MISRWPTLGVLLLATVLAGAAACATVLPESSSPIATPGFATSEVRRPALYVRIAFASGAFSESERARLPGEYEGALLEALNARAVLARDLQLAAGGDARRDASVALARAREVQADHAIVVDVSVQRTDAMFCRETRRPFRAPVTVWQQGLTVLRASDGELRLHIPVGPTLSVTDLEADCENPRQSRRRAPAETVAATVEKLVTRLLGS